MTNKEYEFLTTRLHKISNFYMLPKLHKNEELNEILKNSSSEYLEIKLSTGIEGRPINSGPVYHTSGISKMLHQILLPCLAKIDHILKYSFDFISIIDGSCNDPNTTLVTWDINSLYIQT